MGKKIQVGETIFFFETISFVRLGNQKLLYLVVEIVLNKLTKHHNKKTEECKYKMEHFV